MISALSYFEIPFLVPGPELWHYFYKQSLPFLIYNSKRPYVYAIKKYRDRIEFELYFYRYKIQRDDPHVELDLNINYSEIEKIHPLYLNITLPTNYIISSIDIDNNYKIYTDHINFYYKLVDCYSCEEYNLNTKKNTLLNLYNIDYKILPVEPYHHKFIDKYKDPDTIVFIAKKLQKNHICYYFERANFTVFLQFLNDFNYSNDFILFCKKHYTNNYKFCFSYDIDSQEQVIKSTIFSIYSIHVEHY